MNKNKALFLDRDGVINIDMGYVFKKGEFKFIDGIFELVQNAKHKNYLVIVVTNQAGIGRGYYSENDFIILMEWVKNFFKRNGGAIDDVYFCPFHPIHGVGKYKKYSNMRKPNPGMILKASLEHNINLSESILLGDSITDIQAGKAAGIKKNILISSSRDIEIGEAIIIKNINEANNYL